MNPDYKALYEEAKALADSEGSRAVKYLRIVRKVRAVADEWPEVDMPGSPLSRIRTIVAFAGTTPPAPTTEPTAKPITGLTEEEQRKLIGGFFAEDWAVRAALDLLHDFTRALAEKNGLAVQGGE